MCKRMATRTAAGDGPREEQVEKHTLDDVARAQGERDVARVEHLAVGKLPRVLHLDIVAGLQGEHTFVRVNHPQELPTRHTARPGPAHERYRSSFAAALLDRGHLQAASHHGRPGHQHGRGLTGIAGDQH